VARLARPVRANNTKEEIVMRVLVAGATGVIGQSLVPLLTAVGHEVVALARKEVPGTRTVVADALDPDAVHRAVHVAAPDVVVNMLTAIPAAINPRTMTKDMAVTNRLRVEGTRNLLAAAPGARHIAQSIGYLYDPDGGTGPANEDAPVWRHVPKQWATSLAALTDLERQVTGAGGLALRFGHLYGPGSAFAPDGSMTEQIRAGKLPIVGKRAATWSFTHADDAASAVVAALDVAATGTLNIVDDTPVRVPDWLPEYARLVGGPKPRHVPEFLAKLAVGGWGVAYMTRLRGADNARARLTLDWRPRYGSWRDGYAGATPTQA
jgi:nucleoside-diphosphate-sugar epimerase